MYWLPDITLIYVELIPQIIYNTDTEGIYRLFYINDMGKTSKSLVKEKGWCNKRCIHCLKYCIIYISWMKVAFNEKSVAVE